MILQPMFTQGFFSNDLKIDNNKILQILNSLEYQNTELTRANGANCEISTQRNILLINELKDLQTQINETINFYIKNILEYTVDFKIYASWATKTPALGYSHRHSHPNSWLSGVYYPENSDTSLRFHTPYKSPWLIQSPKNYNPCNSDCFDVEIKKNRVIIFNSFLEHEIILNKENKNRYSIAFNVIPNGEIGQGDSQIKFQ